MLAHTGDKIRDLHPCRALFTLPMLRKASKAVRRLFPQPPGPGVCKSMSDSGLETKSRIISLNQVRCDEEGSYNRGIKIVLKLFACQNCRGGAAAAATMPYLS